MLTKWGDLELRRTTNVSLLLDKLDAGEWPTMEEQRDCLEDLDACPFIAIVRKINGKDMHLGPHECGVEILSGMNSMMEEAKLEQYPLYRPLIRTCNALMQEALSWA